MDNLLHGSMIIRCFVSGSSRGKSPVDLTPMGVIPSEAGFQAKRGISRWEKRHGLSAMSQVLQEETPDPAQAEVA